MVRGKVHCRRSSTAWCYAYARYGKAIRGRIAGTIACKRNAYSTALQAGRKLGLTAMQDTIAQAIGVTDTFICTIPCLVRVRETVAVGKIDVKAYRTCPCSLADTKST